MAKIPKFKKPAPKTAPAKAVRTAVPLDAVGTTPPAPIVRGIPVDALRVLAADRYVFDHERRSSREIYEDKRLNFSAFVPSRTFTEWSVKDDWLTRRKAYIETQEKSRDQQNAIRNGAQRDFERNLVEKAFGAWSQYILPRTDKDGNVMVYPADHELAGYPWLPIPPANVREVVQVWRMLHEASLLMRGDPTSRAEIREPDAQPAIVHTDNRVLNLTTDRVRAMAKLMVLDENPRLVEDAIDIEAEMGEEEKIR